MITLAFSILLAITMYTSGVRVTVLLVQLLAMFSVSQARFNCTVYRPGQGLEFYMFQPQDGDNFVYPNVTCTNTSLEISLVTSYTDTQLEGARILGLFYECTNASGNNATGEVPDSFKFDVNDYVYRVELPSSFVEPGASCLVYGCYEENHLDNYKIYYPIQDQNFICSYTEPSTTASPTTPPTTLATTPPTTPSVTVTLGSLNPSSTTVRPSPTIMPSDSSEASQVTVFTSAPTVITVTTTPMPPHGTINQELAIILAVIVFCVVGIISIVVVMAVLMRIRRRRVQRRKHFIIKYYDYSEPIDPYFNPVDIRAEVKAAVSLVSVFDTFAPYQWTNDTSDDDKSEVLQATEHVEENTSIKSIVFRDEGRADSGKHSTDVIGQEEPKSVTKEPPAKNSTEDSLPALSLLNNGYVPANYLTSKVKTAQLAPSPVTNGYIEEKNYRPSTIPPQGVKPQMSNSYIQHEDMAQNVPVNLTTWNQTRPFRSELPSSTSSGYVTGLSTPSDYRGPTLTSDLEVSVAPTKLHPQRKYNILENGYTVVESERDIVRNAPLDSDSMEYSLDEVVENEGVEEVGDQLYAESIVAECSLSLNPLHFEPIDDLIQEQSSPSYVNTSPDSEQIFHSPSVVTTF